MSETEVFFEQRYYVRLVVDRRQEPITIAVGGPHEIDVHIKSLAAEEQRKDLHEAVSCIASGVWSLKQNTVQSLEGILQGRMPDGGDLEVVWKRYLEDMMKEPAGPGFSRLRTMIDIFPQSLRSTLASVHSELEVAALTVVGLVRWRMDARGGLNPVRQDRGLYGSFDRSSWWGLPGEGYGLDPVSETHARIGTSIQGELKDYIAKDLSQPLAYELLREAFSTREKSPRSALIAAITALEVGVKAYIAAMVPNAEWLAFESPSPPVVKMLSDYLPTLPSQAVSGTFKPPPARVLDTLKKGVHLRNTVVHQGKGKISLLGLREIMDTVADVLRALDYHRGFAWSLQYVREDVRKEWGLV